MALYLGNQKVSLRSGQDPTFDYGFDSNGRLVFANKNATEINNFLNYDSTYSEILDLSNLNKMERVAVNGTVDRKMEGLKGLLVSPNAPFTGSSPQINVSYTGLNKSALVSLFESVPYNVGYKKVGNPTIVDGVASGFSGNDYLKISSNLLFFPNEGKIAFHYTRQSSMNQILIICQFSSYFPFRIRFIDRIIQLSWMTDSTTQAADLTSTYSITEGDYYITFKFSNNVWIVKLYNSANELLETLTSAKTSIYWPSTAPSAKIGYYSSTSYWQGSIDLNETYIKVNGVNWFGPGATKNLVPDGTVVGDVIVKDGIASGFSDSNYLLINDTPFSSSNDVEMIIRFTPTEIESGYLFGFGTSAGIYLTKISDKLRYGIAYNGITQTTAGSSYAIDALNIPYYLHFLFYHSNLNVKMGLSADGLNPTYGIDVTASAAPSITSLLLGKTRVASNYYLRGFIDLNNTYIKVGSDYFYRGMVPMTKTCSIVGATGAADLTQEDKNIILNKGWSLTVQ